MLQCNHLFFPQWLSSPWLASYKWPLGQRGSTEVTWRSSGITRHCVHPSSRSCSELKQFCVFNPCAWLLLESIKWVFCSCWLHCDLREAAGIPCFYTLLLPPQLFGSSPIPEPFCAWALPSLIQLHKVKSCCKGVKGTVSFSKHYWHRSNCWVSQ